MASDTAAAQEQGVPHNRTDEDSPPIWSPGFVIVVIGVAAILLVVAIAAFAVDGSDRASVIAASLSVLGTIVGAFFGHRAGSEGKAEAERERQALSFKVEELNSHLSPEQVSAAMDTAEQRFRDTVTRRRA
jgi:CHASE3 domain sensor protein